MEEQIPMQTSTVNETLAYERTLTLGQHEVDGLTNLGFWPVAMYPEHSEELDELAYTMLTSWDDNEITELLEQIDGVEKVTVVPDPEVGQEVELA